MRDITFVIASCNFPDLKETIDSIRKNTDFGIVNAEFIIVANGLPPEAEEWLKGLGPHFPYIWYSERIGLSRALNIGAAQVTSEIIARMDDDILVLPWGSNSKWLQQLISPFANPKVGIVSPAVFKYDNDYIGGYLSAVGFLIVTRKKIWDELKGMDETMLNAEDSDFSFRVQNLGYEITLPDHTDLPKWNQTMYQANFPIYHKSRLTWLHDDIKQRSENLLIAKYQNKNLGNDKN